MAAKTRAAGIPPDEGVYRPLASATQRQSRRGRDWRLGDQLKESPQAQELPALGLSIVKPCFSMVSAKSIVAPSR